MSRQRSSALLALSVALVCFAALLTACVGTSGDAGRSDVVHVDASSLASAEMPTESEGSAGVGSGEAPQPGSEGAGTPDKEVLPVTDIPAGSAASSQGASASSSSSSADAKQLARKLFAQLNIEEDYRDSFVHGDKPAKYQKYIVLHDTEGDGEASGVVDYWDSSEQGVAAHFVVNKDGSIVQCVPLDKITHHAGFGDTGHNEKYGVKDESRDDKVGTTEVGDWASDYGMNSYSVGIEMVHVGGSGDYPEEQLQAVDDLIAYIDTYFGKESRIIDHKAWRSGNSDTSEEFSEYLKNYQDHRTHNEKTS